MRRLLALAIATAAVVPGAAAAGDVCVNGECRNVPGAYGRASISLTGQVKVMGGLTGGPGLATTGVESLSVKPDEVAVYPIVNGAALGRYGATFDYGDEVYRFYLGPHGCRQIGDDAFLGPCVNDPDQ